MRALPYISLVVLLIGMAIGQQSDQSMLGAATAVNSQRITTLELQYNHMQVLSETVASMKATVDSDHQLLWTLLIATLLNVLSGLLGKGKTTEIVEKVRSRATSAGN